MDSSGGFPGGNRVLSDARCSQEAAQDLAAAIADLLQELHQTRCALWQREAELAAGVPVMPHPDEQTHLAERLESVLKAGAQAVGCQAAAIYLLDDATRKLKLRACWGLPRSRFVDSPRPLRGATADLEALVGHAVIVRNAELLPNWQIPEEFRSAVCVPISSPTTPFGTLWTFCDHGRDFSVDETNLIEIVAGRIAADLERAVLLNQTLKLRSLARQLTHAAQWQQHRLPRIKPMLPGWDLSGWTAQAGAMGGDFHDWFVLLSGDLAVAVGDAQGKMFESGLTTATLHTALCAHASLRPHGAAGGRTHQRNPLDRLGRRSVRVVVLCERSTGDGRDRARSSRPRLRGRGRRLATHAGPVGCSAVGDAA